MIRVCSSERDDMGKMAKKINASGRNKKTKQKNKQQQKSLIFNLQISQQCMIMPAHLSKTLPGTKCW